MPQDANNLGHIFGGVILSLMDKTAAISAFRHSRASVVTASIDRVAKAICDWKSIMMSV